MSYSLYQTVAPAAEPLTRDEAKAHLRVTSNYEDALIDRLIAGVRRLVEARTNRCLVTQTWRLTLDNFPYGPYSGQPKRLDDLWDGYAILLPKTPVSSVTSVNYVAPDGTNTVLTATTDYVSDIRSLPPRITPAYGKYWPVPRYQAAAVWVDFVAGYGAYTAVPEDFKVAILLWVSHLYANREAVSQGAMAEVPMGVDAILGVNWDGAMRWEQGGGAPC